MAWITGLRIPQNTTKKGKWKENNKYIRHLMQHIARGSDEEETCRI